MEQHNSLAPKAPYLLPRYEGPQLPQAHGVLVLHKPKGPTSARCLSTLKRMGQKKIGHAGTLDPMAEGVLLVLLGHATKISGHLLTDGNKIYSGTVLLGQQSDTWDAEGSIVATAPWEHITEDELYEAFESWRGKSMQTVPPYSAAKHQGQPLYKLARAGKATPVKEKEIEISQMEVLHVELPFARFRVECSSGTYIRSLAHSLGTRLQCGAVLTELTREYSHPFGIDEAHTLDAILAEPERLHEWVIPITRALPHWPVVTLTEEEERKLKHGMPLPYRDEEVQDHESQGETEIAAPVTMEAMEESAEEIVEQSQTPLQEQAEAEPKKASSDLSLEEALRALQESLKEETTEEATQIEEVEAISEDAVDEKPVEDAVEENLQAPQAVEEAYKAILLNAQGIPLALAEKKMVRGTGKQPIIRPMWTVLRGLW